MRRFDANGAPVGAALQANTQTTGYQEWPAVLGLADGGFIVAWSGGAQSAPSGIFTQRYDADGDPVGGEVQISASGDAPQLTQLESGTVVVTWYAYVDGPNATEVFARLIDVVQSTGTEDQPVTLPFTVSLTDTDGSEVLDLVRIEGLPEGFTLAVGAREGSPTGAWVIARNAATTDAFLDDLAAGTLGLVATPAAGYNGNFTLTITATSREIANGDTVTSAAVLVPVSIAPNDPPVAVDDAATTPARTRRWSSPRRTACLRTTPMSTRATRVA